MDPNWLPFLNGLTAGAVMGLGLWLFVRGDIVSRSTHEDVKTQRDEAAAALKTAVDAFDQALSILKQRLP